jgi:hypothetical protein
LIKLANALSYRGNGTTEIGGTRDAPRLTRAEEVFARKKQKDDERLSNQAKDREVQLEKTARLRGLRLAQEAVTKEKKPGHD